MISRKELNEFIQAEYHQPAIDIALKYVEERIMDHVKCTKGNVTQVTVDLSAFPGTSLHVFKKLRELGYSVSFFSQSTEGFCICIQL